MITGTTRMAAVLAKPIKHSLSPFIHNLAFTQSGEDGVYLAFEIEETSLADSISMIKSWHMYGVNLSMPYKQLAIAHMDELSGEVTKLGAMNTVVNRDGRLIGYNTDGVGFVNSLNFYGIELTSQRVLILGAGGAAMAIIYALAQAGVAQLVVAKRQNETFEAIKTKLRQIAEEISCEIDVIPFEASELKLACQQATMIVNTTNVGMTGQTQERLIEADWLTSKPLVIDIIYQPLTTPFLAMAQQQGCKTYNGVGMLLFQALAAFELWTGQQVDPEPIYQQLTQLIEEKNKQ
ncbi:shikimate dehydrogenase [Vagococcus zengguangii]|uniref:Shikimate dehydrogenase (NADP(+)) n=1 Tax=Vagococcus zengguangii TaxID=2571750 RepID=A0A4D7CPW5_9ENTE|nr:shikimate dehydrogenase [Vagococcus zengguangii]QCI86128.1 shikimate dehydrogenase [Vagococcus zengguangii]